MSETLETKAFVGEPEKVIYEEMVAGRKRYLIDEYPNLERELEVICQGLTGDDESIQVGIEGLINLQGEGSEPAKECFASLLLGRSSKEVYATNQRLIESLENGNLREILLAMSGRGD
ncbi:hypothetical protein A2Z41_03145 [Microgenomates group bacterium RBG_19FT_COMBO_39_10]|nr:MAG: hypothetical protein A2Z41_03145 [Microgenomates group bacterium RBG_19FT_COMBO_39_10]